MKTFFGVFTLLIVAAIVGVFAVEELHQMTDAAGGSGAVISATATGATPQSESQQIQQQVQNSVDVAVNQARPVPAAPDDD
jgi:hypothetical protein